MNEMVAINGTRASFVEAPSGRDDGTIVPKKDWFADLAKALWPVKGPAAIQQYTQCPDRTARAYSSGDREPPASVLRDLLRGNEGYRVLKFVMHGSTTTWWVNVQSELRVAEAFRALAPKLQEVLHGQQT